MKNDDNSYFILIAIIPTLLAFVSKYFLYTDLIFDIRILDNIISLLPSYQNYLNLAGIILFILVAYLFNKSSLSSKPKKFKIVSILLLVVLTIINSLDSVIYNLDFLMFSILFTANIIFCFIVLECFEIDLNLNVDTEFLTGDKRRGKKGYSFKIKQIHDRK